MSILVYMLVVIIMYFLMLCIQAIPSRGYYLWLPPALPQMVQSKDGGLPPATLSVSRTNLYQMRLLQIDR